jgi:hypothetical protein
VLDVLDRFPGHLHGFVGMAMFFSKRVQYVQAMEQSPPSTEQGYDNVGGVISQLDISHVTQERSISLDNFAAQQTCNREAVSLLMDF